MDSVYEAARKHADELKAELQAVETFLDLHEHFRGRFGLTETTETTPIEATAERDAPKIAADEPTDDSDVETHETAVETAAAKTEADDEEPESAALEASELDAPDSDAAELDAPELEASERKASEPEAVDPEAPVHADADADADADAEPEGETRVIKASEGVLVAATAEVEPGAPLAQTATLQAVAEKLAATIGGTHATTVGAAG
jgi:hypothetical protein